MSRCLFFLGNRHNMLGVISPKNYAKQTGSACQRKRQTLRWVLRLRSNCSRCFSISFHAAEGHVGKHWQFSLHEMQIIESSKDVTLNTHMLSPQAFLKWKFPVWNLKTYASVFAQISMENKFQRVTNDQLILVPNPILYYYTQHCTIDS